ncbi:MAG TPA: CHAT domain-containing protein, partial [Roseiflexaceae bacterium]|nr:CHAT domain-containing protein [Roseiflexaceae bacterium]
HYELRDLDDAERYFRDAAAIYAAVDDEHHLAMSWNELGLVLRDGGRWDEAYDTLQRAGAIFERQHAQDALGIVLGNIGEVELARGRYAQSMALFERAIGLMTSRVYAVDYRINMGLLAQAQGNHQAALAHYHAAREVADELGRRESLALIHYRQGHALQRLGHAAEARQQYEVAMQAVEDVRVPMRDESLLISLMGRWQLVYEAAFLLSHEQGDTDAAFSIAERARARAFADQLARHDADDPQPVAPIDAAAARALLPSGTLLLAYFCTGLRGDDYRLLQAMPPEAQGLRDCLAMPARLVGMALTRDSVAAFISALNPNVLHSAAGRHDGTRFLGPATLTRLGDALLGPLAAQIEQAGRLVVIPHGPLHQVPFAALPDHNGHSLIERIPEVRIAPSATVLLRVLPERAVLANQRCLALGYDGGERALRHTEAEARSIAAMFGTQAWIGQPGMRERLLREAGQFRYLHLACHGEFDLADPLASWLEV